MIKFRGMPDAGDDDPYEVADEPKAVVTQLRRKPEPAPEKPIQLDYRTSKILIDAVVYIALTVMRWRWSV